MSLARVALLGCGITGSSATLRYALPRANLSPKEMITHPVCNTLTICLNHESRTGRVVAKHYCTSDGLLLKDIR
jgi:hypothetical protein